MFFEKSILEGSNIQKFYYIWQLSSVVFIYFFNPLRKPLFSSELEIMGGGRKQADGMLQ